MKQRCYYLHVNYDKANEFVSIVGCGIGRHFAMYSAEDRSHLTSQTPKFDDLDILERKQMTGACCMYLWQVN